MRNFLPSPAALLRRAYADPRAVPVHVADLISIDGMEPEYVAGAEPPYTSPCCAVSCPKARSSGVFPCVTFPGCATRRRPGRSRSAWTSRPASIPGTTSTAPDPGPPPTDSGAYARCRRQGCRTAGRRQLRLTETGAGNFTVHRRPLCCRPWPSQQPIMAGSLPFHQRLPRLDRLWAPGQESAGAILSAPGGKIPAERPVAAAVH
jgi:hypothetical protein